MIVGVVGGIAGGKSAAAAALAAATESELIQADRLAHEALREPAIREAVAAKFGRGVLASDGEIDRKALAAQVFGPEAEKATALAWLESVIHPRVRAAAEATIRSVQAADRDGMIVLDVPLLLEVGWASMCDRIVYVDTPRELHLRLAASRGWDERQLHDREAKQWPLERKRAAASDVLVNAGTLEQLTAAANLLGVKLSRLRSD